MKNSIDNHSASLKKSARSMKKRTLIKPDESVRTTISKTLSLPPSIHDAANERRKQERRSFSNYIATLIEKDAKEAAVAIA